MQGGNTGGKPRLAEGEQEEIREKLIEAYRAKKPSMREGIATHQSLKKLVKANARAAAAQEQDD